MTLDFSETLIVLPAFNEEAVIADVIREVLTALPGVTCLVVNDGSTDSTTTVARKAGALVAELPYNLGVGGAMRFGFRYARSWGFQNVVQVDADGQHNAEDVPALLEKLREADLVLGARFAGKGEYAVRGPRKWAMTALSNILSKSSKTTLNDTTSGFRASGPRAVELFSKYYPAEYLGDTVESLVIASRANLVIRQVPVAMRERAGGTPSHSPIKAAVFLVRVGIAVLFAFMRPTIHTSSERAR